MTQKHDISATEKLLDLIRKGQATPPQRAEESCFSGQETPAPAPSFSLEMEAVEEEPTEFSFAPPPASASNPAQPASPIAPSSFTLELDSPDETKTAPESDATPPETKQKPEPVPPPQPAEPQVHADEPLILAVGSDDSTATIDTRLASGQTDATNAEPAKATMPPADGGRKSGALLTGLMEKLAERFSGDKGGGIIGIDIQHEYLTVVAGTKNRGVFRLREYRQITKESLAEKDQDSGDDSAWFEAPLVGLLRGLGGGHGQQVWCAIPVDLVDVHNLTIPKIPEQQRPNAIYWATRKEAAFDENEVVFDFSITGDFKVKGQDKTAFVAYLAKGKNIDRLKKLVAQAGMSLVGVTTHATALQHLLPPRLLSGATEPVAALHIDIHKSYINVYAGKAVLFSREVNTGLSSLNEQAYESFQHRTDAPAADDEIFSPRAFDHYDLQAVSRLLRQMQRTFDYCSSNFEVPAISRVLISGFPSQCEEFIAHCRNEMGVDCAAVEPLEGGKVVTTSLFPPAGNDLTPIRCSLSTALGLAVAEKMSCQNFLFTQKDKEGFRLARKINIAILFFFFALLGCAGVGYTFLSQAVKSLEAEVRPLRAAIEHEIATLGTKDPQQALTKKVAQIVARKNANLDLAARYAQIALTSEICGLLPNEISLISLDFKTMRKEAAKEPAEPAQHAAPALPSFRIRIEAVVAGTDQTREFLLASFLHKLGQSKIIAARPDIEEKETVKVNGNDVLRFLLDLKTAPPGRDAIQVKQEEKKSAAAG